MKNSIGKQDVADSSEHLCLPWLWAVCAFENLIHTNPLYVVGEDALLYQQRLASDIATFAKEAHKLDYELKSVWSTDNKIVRDSPTMLLRSFPADAPRNFPILINAPYAGHSATITDFSPDQSLVRSLIRNGLTNIYVTDWKSATEAMKDFSIDTYLQDLNDTVDSLGGKVHLIGICQGGWMSSMYAALYPGKVVTLVLGGAPIDTDLGDGAIKKLAHTLPMQFYRDLVEAGGGRLLGKFMLAGWKGMNPTDNYMKKYVELFTHIEEEDYLQHAEIFSRWYETPLDLPGVYYLQAVEWLFKDNLLAKGNFIALGKVIVLKNINIPIYMLAGEADNITPPAQVFAAENYFGTASNHRVKKMVFGGHIGLFMGHKNLNEVWPEISQWILSYDTHELTP
jgi:polyhydroxyalkanoate depolymerase